MQQLQTLEAVLQSTDSLPDDGVLFLQSGREWSLATPAAVLSIDRFADDDDLPEFAKTNGLERVLQVHQVQDVVSNARLQRANVTSEMLVKALLFYFRRDAFIDFDKSV